MGEPAEESISAVLEDLAASVNADCQICHRRICGHEVLFGRLLGFRGFPHCLDCLARDQGRAPAELRLHLHQHIERRDCYLAGWRQANRNEGFSDDELPRCVFPAATKEELTVVVPLAVPTSTKRSELRTDAEWDAGNMGCGDLVLELRLRLRELRPGAVLRVIALDPGAPEDLPAWCRLTGHQLIAHFHPEYWIQHKET